MKTSVYVSTAILLGLAIMILPKTIELQLMMRSQGENITDDIFPTSEDGYKMTPFGFFTQPMNLLAFGLIFLTGLIAALGVYAVTRKRLS